MPNSRTDQTLAAVLQAVEPLVQLLLREGISYQQFGNALKSTFLAAAEQVLAENGRRVNDSSLSTVSGVHRKDARVWRSEGRAPPRARSMSFAMQVCARWMSHPDFCDKKGKPRALVRNGRSDSFDALVHSVSKDVHPHSVLNEMIRLGAAREITARRGIKRIELCADAFVPRAGSSEMLRLFADNVGDHAAAAASNIQGGAPMLEQAVFAAGLREVSVEKLNALARGLWAGALQKVAREATKLHRLDQGHPEAKLRFRFGMYSYHGSNDAPETNPPGRRSSSV